MLKDTLSEAMIPSPRGCCQLQSISVVVQCTTSVNMNSSQKTREVDLSINEGSKESRFQLGSMCSPLANGGPARVLPYTNR